MRTSAKPIRLVNQQINALAALQDPLDILGHNIADAIDFAPGGREGVCWRGGVVGLEERAQLVVEGSAAVGGQCSEVGCGRVVGG